METVVQTVLVQTARISCISQSFPENQNHVYALNISEMHHFP